MLSAERVWYRNSPIKFEGEAHCRCEDISIR